MQDGPPSHVEATYAAGWYPDPTGVHELRYHNGRTWTGDVSTGGVRYVAPLTPFAAPSPVAGHGQRSGTLPFVLGIVSMCLGWIPFVCVAAIGLSVGAIVAGFRRRSSESARSAANIGIVTGAVGLVFSIGGLWLSVALVNAVADFDDPGPHEATLTSCAETDGLTRATGTITNLDDRTHTYTVEITFDGDRTVDFEVTDVAAGSTAPFDIDENLRFDPLDCSIVSVRGPRPFGIDTTN